MSKPSNIPQAIWDAAKAVVDQFDTDWTYDGRSDGVTELQDAIELVAVALMAETTACQRIAVGFVLTLDTRGGTAENPYVDVRRVASAIAARNKV